MDTDIATALATDVRSLLGLEDNTDGNTGRQAIISALKLLPNSDGGVGTVHPQSVERGKRGGHIVPGRIALPRRRAVVLGDGASLRFTRPGSM
jgi:hypothetical protein